MKLGIFSKTFPRDTVDDVFQAVAGLGLDSVQFNMACAGPESLPAEIPQQLAHQIHQGLIHHRLTMCGISATFNTIHPDSSKVREGIKRFGVLASEAKAMGSDLLTLCTGTRNIDSMWKPHPANSSPEAYRDLLGTMTELLDIAEQYDLRLGVEPEIHNVIDSSAKAACLLKDLDSPRLGIIIDPANILHHEDLPRMDEILKNAFDILGTRIILAHAKDLTADEPIRYIPAGTGCLNYQLYIRLLREIRYDGPLVLHNLSESQAPASIRYLKSLLD